jgi:hypothetical protein
MFHFFSSVKATSFRLFFFRTGLRSRCQILNKYNENASFWPRPWCPDWARNRRLVGPPLFRVKDRVGAAMCIGMGSVIAGFRPSHRLGPKSARVGRGGLAENRCRIGAGRAGRVRAASAGRPGGWRGPQHRFKKLVRQTSGMPKSH